jgi:hypothetical protein
MPYQLSYFEEAKKDIIEAKKWYYNVRRGLEERFAADVKTTISRLKANPHIHAVRYKQYRIANTDIFPYSIHFYIDEPLKRVVVVGIVHCRRNFDFLKQRNEP